MRTIRITSATAAGFVAVFGLSACSLEIKEGVCMEDEYAAYAVSNPHGAQCVKDGERPPKGMAAYPPCRAPHYVGDEYDRWPLGKHYPWKAEVDLTAQTVQPYDHTDCPAD